MSTVLYWFLACAFPPPDCAEGYRRNDAGSCVVLPDRVEDTGLDALSGAYQGEISISIEADASGVVIEDVCAGTVAFDVDGGAVNGLVRCSFSGTVAGFIGNDPFEGTMDGSVTVDGSSAGQILLDLDAFGVLDEGWTGTVTEDGIDGSFVGTMSFLVGALDVPVQFEGSFSATP